MKNLDYIFNTLNNPHTCCDLATLNIYDEKEGDSAKFALGFGARDDYSGDEMEALADKLHAASGYSEIQKILESLPDRYTVYVDNISIVE